MADGGQINLRLSLKGAEQVRAELAKVGPEGSRALRELDRGLRQPTAGLVALDAASGQVRNGLDDLANRGGAAGNVIGRLGPWGLAAAAGLGAAVAVLSIMIVRAREAMALAADLTDTANRIGVSTEALQRWGYVADEAGVPVQTLQQDMERLNGTLGRFKLGIGDGRLRPIFEELGITAADLENVQTADQLMLLLADTLGQVRDQATAVRMAEAMGIRESLPILQLGSQRLRELMDAADDLGVVLDQRVVAELDAADRQLELAGQQMQNTVTIGVAPLASSLGEAAEAWGLLMVRAQDFQAQAPGLVQWLLRIAAAAAPGGNAARPGIEGIFAPRGPRDTFDPSRMDPAEMTDLRGRALLDSLSPRGGFELQGHTSGGGSQTSAEQEARKAEQRRRALEDLAAELDLETARLTNNQALVRELERQRAERQFMRRLQDLEVPQAQQLALLEERRTRLAEAQAESRARATQAIEDQLLAEVARIDEAYSIEREQERIQELQRRVEAYQRIYDLEEATRLAEADQAVVDEARVRAAQRWLDIAAEAHELELARLSGDRESTRELERQNWLRERSLELQKAGRLVPREADEQAEQEWAERESARRRGLLREGIQDFLEGVRRGNLEGFFENLADRFSSRLEERMADQLVPLFEQLANMLLNALTQGGRGGGGGWGDFLGQVMGAFGFGSSNPFGMGGGRAPGDFLPDTGVSGGNGGGPSVWNGSPLGAPSASAWSKATATFDAAAAALSAAISKAHAVRPAEPAFALAGVQPVGGAGMRVEVNNYGSEPMQAEVRQTPTGAQVDLYPQFQGMMKRAGSDGTLEKSAALSPRPRRRG